MRGASKGTTRFIVSMKLITDFPSFLSAFALSLYISTKYSAHGAEAKITDTLLDGSSADEAPVFEAPDNAVIVGFTKQTARTVATARVTASDTTAEIQGSSSPGEAASDTSDELHRSSRPVFSFDADVEASNESSKICEEARLCSLNNEYHPDRCSCHSHCHLFGDCCEDAAQTNSSKIAGPLPRTAYSCFTCNSPFAKAVNIITSCPEHYDVEAVVNACNRSRLFRENDQILDTLSTPLTDGSTGLTYGNAYCALCWNANPETSELWLWSFHCNNITIGNESNTKRAATFRSSGNSSTSEKNGLPILTYLRTMCTSSFVPPRKFSAPFAECESTEISTCPSSFDPTDKQTAHCHSSPLRRVYHNKVAYRNVHCLACNHVKDQPLAWSCLPPIDSTISMWNFAILASPSTDICNVNEGFSQMTVNSDDLCRLLAPCIARDRQSIKCTGVYPSAIVEQEGKCRALNDTSLCSFNEVFDESYITCRYLSLFSNETLIVQLNATVAMCYACVSKSFENYTMVNGFFAVAVNGTSRLYNSLLTFVNNGILSQVTSSVVVTTLSPMENDGTGCSSNTLPWGIPLTTFLISQCCLVAFFTLYAISQRLRHFLGEIVLNQSIAFFLEFTFFAIRWITNYSPSVCRPLLILIHYFNTAAFTWTSLVAIEVARAVSTIVNSAPPSRGNSRRVAYYVVGWCAPLVPVVLGIIADELSLEIRPSYGTWLCWFGQQNGFSVFVAGPMCICQTIDVVVYVYVIIRLAVLERQTRIARETRREKLLLSVKLLVALGLPWAFSIAASFSDVDWVRCSFKVVASLQGTFTLLIFGIKRDIMASLSCCRSRSENLVSAQSSSSVVNILPSPEMSAPAPVTVVS